MPSLPRPSFRLLLALSVLVLITGTGCDLLNDPDPPSQPVTAGVYVANQGNFGEGNGSLSIYDPETQEVERQAIPPELGTIIQSIAFHNDRLYLMGNTAGRVDAYEPETRTLLGQIEGVESPRYSAQVGPQKAYVTGTGDFAGEQGTVTAIDLSTDEVLEEIEVGGNPEGLAVVDEQAFVATGGFSTGDTVAVLDTGTDTVLDKLNMECDTPRHVFPTTSSDVLVICTGSVVYDENFNPVGENPGALRLLSAPTGERIGSLDLEVRLATAGSGQDAFFVPEVSQLFAATSENTILRISTTTLEIIDEIGPLEGDPIGAIAVDAVEGRLYLGRVPGFDQGGTVTVHELDGTQIDEFEAGVGPSHILFRHEHN